MGKREDGDACEKAWWRGDKARAYSTHHLLPSHTNSNPSAQAAGSFTFMSAQQSPPGEWRGNKRFEVVRKGEMTGRSGYRSLSNPSRRSAIHSGDKVWKRTLTHQMKSIVARHICIAC